MCEREEREGVWEGGDERVCGRMGGEGVWEGGEERECGREGRRRCVGGREGEGVWEGRGGEGVQEGGEERVCGRGGEGGGGDKHPDFHIGLVLLVYIVLGSMPLSVTTVVTI